MSRSLLDAKGSAAIPMTPFTEDDKIDVPILEKEIEFLVDCKVGCICTPLMVSEFQSLSVEERKLMIRVPLEVNNGNRIVIANVTAVDTHTAIEYAVFSEKLGADAVNVMPPYVGNLDKGGMLRYYGEIANAISIPVMIQNHAQASLTSPEVVELCTKYENISWVKQEVAPGPDSIADLMAVRTNAIEGIMSGFGGLYSPLDFALGATATIHACQICDLIQHEWNLLFEGKNDEARDYHAKILPLLQLEIMFGWSLSKEVMVRRGIFKNSIVRNKEVGLPRFALDELDRVWHRIEPMLLWKN